MSAYMASLLIKGFPNIASFRSLEGRCLMNTYEKENIKNLGLIQDSVEGPFKNSFLDQFKGRFFNLLRFDHEPSLEQFNQIESHKYKKPFGSKHWSERSM